MLRITSLRTPKLTMWLYAISAAVLVALDMRLLGWGLLALTFGHAALLSTKDRRLFWAICVSLAIIAVTPIGTHYDAGHALAMLVGMVAAVLVPYLLIQKYWGYDVIRYKLHHGRRWHTSELLYVFFPALAGYFVGPLFFVTTGLYTHWDVILDPSHLILLFIGLLAVGAWDEFIFIATIWAVMRRYTSFWVSNIAQAIVFSSFLYELGFRSWSVFFAMLFAMVQCYIFNKKQSLIYAITIHIVFDVMLFLVLINAHYPQYLRIFITN